MTVLFLKRITLFPVDPAPSRWLSFGKHLKKIPKVLNYHLAQHFWSFQNTFHTLTLIFKTLPVFNHPRFQVGNLILPSGICSSVFCLKSPFPLRVPQVFQRKPGNRCDSAPSDGMGGEETFCSPWSCHGPKMLKPSPSGKPGCLCMFMTSGVQPVSLWFQGTLDLDLC